MTLQQWRCRDSLSGFQTLERLHSLVHWDKSHLQWLSDRAKFRAGPPTIYVLPGFTGIEQERSCWFTLCEHFQFGNLLLLIEIRYLIASSQASKLRWFKTLLCCRPTDPLMGWSVELLALLELQSLFFACNWYSTIHTSIPIHCIHKHKHLKGPSAPRICQILSYAITPDSQSVSRSFERA